MYYFVTIGVDGDEGEPLRRRGFQVRSSGHSRLVAALKQDAFEVTLGGCSCDFYLRQLEQPDVETRLRRKGKRRGWSQAKIQRAVEDALKAAQPKTNSRWQEFLDGLSEIQAAGSRVSMYAHWYRGDVAGAWLNFAEERTASLADLHDAMPEDVVLRLESRAQR